MPNTGNSIQTTTNIVGYSSTDFFYENPSYCPKNNNGYINGVKTGPLGLPVADNEPKCGPNDKECLTTSPCTLNEYYGSQLQNDKKALDTGIARYNNTLETYNRELLRTINYLAGIGMLAAYIYVNQ